MFRETRSLGINTEPYEEQAPNNSQSVNSVISLAGPSHGRCICLKQRVDILRPTCKVVVFRNLTACMGNGTTWLPMGNGTT